MALGTPYTLATDVTATSTATTIAMTTTTKGNSGDRVIIESAYRAASPSAMSCADNAGTGNTYHLDKQQDGGNGQVGIFSVVLGADLPIGTVITVTGGSATRRWMRAHALSGTAAGNPDANHVGGDTNSGTAPTAATAGSTAASGDYAVATLSRYGAGAGDTATAGGTGTFVEKADAVLGSGTPRMHYYSETQALGSGGTITASPSWSSTTGGWEAAIVVYAGAGVTTWQGDAALTQTTSMTAAGIRTRLGAAANVMTGSSTAAGIRTRLGAAAMAMSASATAAGLRLRKGAATDTVTGTSTAAGTRGRKGVVTDTSTGTNASGGVIGAYQSSVVLAEEFDGGRTTTQFFDNVLGTTVSLDATHVKSGATSLLIHKTGSASTSKRNVQATRVSSGRFWIYVAANPSATFTFFAAFTPGATTTAGTIRITTAGKVGIGFNGGTFQTSAASLNLNAWNSVDFTFDTSGATFTADLKLNGVSNTQATIADAANDQTIIGVDTGGSITYDAWIDRFQWAAGASQYPLTDTAAISFGAAALTETTSQTAAGIRTRFGASALTESTTQTAAGIRTRKGAAALTETTSQTSAGVITHKGVVTNTVTATSTSAGIRGRKGAASLVSKGGPTVLGVSNQVLGGVVLTDVEALLGRPFSGLRQNQDISVHGFTNADAFFLNPGYRFSYRSIQVQNAGDWASLAAGGFDTDIDAIGVDISDGPNFDFDHPFYVCFHHETSISSPSIGTAQEYIDAFRYWRNRWDAAGVTRYKADGTYNGGSVVMCYIGWDRMFTNGAVNSPDPGESYADFDPDLGSSPAAAGTSYYELCGSDVYNDMNGSVLKYGTDAATLMDDVVAQAVARGKDFILGEWGCADSTTTQNHLDKAAWLDSFSAYLAALPAYGPGRCLAAIATVKASSSNYNVDSSAQALASYQALASSDTFQGGRGAEITFAQGTVTGVAAITGAADLTQNTSMTAAGRRGRKGAAALTETTTQAIAGTYIKVGRAALVMSATSSSTGQPTRKGTAGLVMTSSTSATGTRTIVSEAHLVMTAVGLVRLPRVVFHVPDLDIDPHFR